MTTTHTFPLAGPLLRGSRCPRVALIGQPRAGKSRIFRAASSTVVHHERLAGVGPAYAECQVEVGLEQISSSICRLSTPCTPYQATCRSS